MPFVVPVKAMALTVSTLMCGTMFTTYYYCVHDSECPALPKLVRVASLRRILDSVARHRGRWTGGCVQPGHALLALASDGVAVHGVPSGRHATRCEG